MMAALEGLHGGSAAVAGEEHHMLKMILKIMALNFNLKFKATGADAQERVEGLKDLAQLEL